jgi:hypothetical protein
MGEIVDDEALTCVHHQPGERAGGRQRTVRKGGLRKAGEDPHLDLGVGTPEHDRGDVRIRDLPGAVGDGLQRLVLRRGAEQHRGDLRGRGQPPFAAGGFGVQPGVLDRHAGSRSQRNHDRLVLLGEVAASRLLGEVEVAEHLSRIRTGTPRKERIAGNP